MDSVPPGGVDLDRLVAGLPDAVVVADAGGAIRLWNAAAGRVFGFTADEALGRSLDLIIPERFRERHWAGYREVVRSGHTRYGTELLRVPALRRDGARISIAMTVALLTAADGRVEGVVAVIREETARWQEEQALRRRLAELEPPRRAP